MNSIEAPTYYQLDPKATNSEKCHNWNGCKVILSANSLNGSASSCLLVLLKLIPKIGLLSERFQNQFDSAIFKIQAKAEAQFNKIKTNDSISVCHVEELVNKGWPGCEVEKWKLFFSIDPI